MTLIEVYQPFIEAGIPVVSIWSVLVWGAHKLFDMAVPSVGADSGPESRS